MGEETAKIIVIGITGVGALVWLAALAVVMRCGHERRAPVAGVPRPGYRAHRERLARLLALKVAIVAITPPS